MKTHDRQPFKWSSVQELTIITASRRYLCQSHLISIQSYLAKISVSAKTKLLPVNSVLRLIPEKLQLQCEIHFGLWLMFWVLLAQLGLYNTHFIFWAIFYIFFCGRKTCFIVLALTACEHFASDVNECANCRQITKINSCSHPGDWQKILHKSEISFRSGSTHISVNRCAFGLFRCEIIY